MSLAPLTIIPKPRSAAWLVVLCALLLPASAFAGIGRHGEVVLSDKVYAKLDPFEAHSLKQADQAFPFDPKKRKTKALREAAAAYDSFIAEFPRSKALSYALLRKARCLHLEEKRYEAIKAYQEVLDYFPNDIPHASAALYYTGECHWLNGEEDDALKAWAEMAEDEDYSKSRFAGTAINKLADALAKRGEPERAVKYWSQLAVDFRNKAPDDANAAIGKVIGHYIRTAPNDPELRTFYTSVRGFGGKPAKISEDFETNKDYWNHVRRNVWRHGQFKDGTTPEARRYYAYWSQQLAGRFPKWDDYQLDAAAFKLRADGDTAKWIKQVDAQFERGDTADYGRVIKWIRVYRGQKAKAEQYYQKLNFAKMSNGQIRAMMDAAYNDLKNPEMGKRVFGQMRLSEMDDKQRQSLARAMWYRDARSVERVTNAFEDKAFGKIELLRFYANRKTMNVEKGIPLAQEVVGLPDYANEAYWLKGTMHKAKKEYREAIASFQSFRPAKEDDPANLFEIADCYAKMGKLGQCIQQLGEIETFFEKSAPEAAFRAAKYYEKAGKKEQYIAALRGVMSKYPKSGQSREVHHRLEKMDLRIGGGLDDPDS